MFSCEQNSCTLILNGLITLFSKTCQQLDKQQFPSKFLDMGISFRYTENLSGFQRMNGGKDMDRGKQKKIMFAVFILLLMLSQGCAVKYCDVCEKDGQTYGWPGGIFRNQWDDYYQCVLSYMDGACYDAALDALDQSLAQRHEDRRMARTWGMHFTDYFPHREKGIIHYMMQDYHAAKKELELSLRQEPSAKAFFYLDKVRKSIMQRDNQAVAKPRLSLADMAKPAHEIWTSDDPVIISGTAEDTQYVSEITVGDRQVFMEGSGQLVSFREKIRLDQGKHFLDIVAKNLLGGTAKHRLILHVDRSGPVIILRKIRQDTEIQAYLYDEAGGISLLANSKAIPLPKGKKIRFTLPLNTGKAPITLLATDRLGNKTEAVLTKEMMMEIVSVNQDAVMSQFPFSVLLAEHSLSKILTDAGNTAFRLAKSDRAHPEIILDGLSASEVVFRDRIDISGQVRCEKPIESVSINHVPVPVHPGQIIFFSHSVRLKKGKNKIIIRARDENGSASVKTVTIKRKVPEAFQTRHRYCLAMYPFDNGGSEKQQGLFQYFLLDHLMRHERFQMMARDKLRKLFEASSPTTAALQHVAGTAPDATLLGSIYETRNGVEIAARLIDVESGEILAIKDAYSESGGRESLEQMARTLSEKFHRAFPLMDAAITHVEPGRLMITPEEWMPAKGDIRMRWPLILYRGDTDAEVIGHAEIDGVSEEKYWAKPLNRQTFEIRKGDKVITR